MDKTTVSEYGYAILAAIIALTIIVFLTGAYFNDKVADVAHSFVPEHEVVDYLSNDAFAEYIGGGN